jgi:hypothetical protein
MWITQLKSRVGKYTILMQPDWGGWERLLVARFAPAQVAADNNARDIQRGIVIQAVWAQVERN